MSNFDFKKHLTERIQTHCKKVQDWIYLQSQTVQPNFYSSIDLRDAGYKIAPVDSNFYPAGFNNICPVDRASAGGVFRRRFQEFATRIGRPIQKVLLIPETHTSNKFYLDNIYHLSQLLEAAGAQVRLGWYPSARDTLKAPFSLTSNENHELHYYETEIRDGQLISGDFIPDLVVINNDFSSGYPEALDQAQKSLIVPSYKMGWHTRKKALTSSTTIAWLRSCRKSLRSIHGTSKSKPRP